MLLSVIAAISFVQILCGGSRAWWAIYFLSVTVGLYTHLFMIALPLFATLFLLFRWRSCTRVLRGWIVCHVSMMLLYLPWILVIIRNLDKTTGFQKSVGPIAVLYSFFTYSVGFTLGPSVGELQQNASLESIVPYIPIVAVSAAVFGVTGLAGVLGLKKNKDSLLFLLLYLVTPMALVYGISSFTNVTYYVRYASTSFPAFLVLAALGLARIRVRVGIVLGGAVLCLFAVSLKNHYFDSRYFTEDMQSTAAYIESEATQDDLIFVISTVVPFLYYYDGRTPVNGLDHIDMTSEQNVISKLRRTAEGRSRIWLVLAKVRYRDPYGAAKRYLDQHHTLLGARKFPGTEIYCYQLE